MRRRSRSRRNLPWGGSTQAEHDHLRGSRVVIRRRPKRSRESMPSGVLLGHLTELIIAGRGGRDRKLSARVLRGAFLGWIPGRDQLAVVYKAKGNPGRLSPKSVDIFRRFHQTKPQRAQVYEWPTARRLRQVGLVRSLTYVVPDWVKSPGKRGYRWVHAFGDHGERGHGPHDGSTPVYPTTLMPALCKDQDGNFHIVRRPGNKYDVTEWIYW